MNVVGQIAIVIDRQVQVECARAGCYRVVTRGRQSIGCSGGACAICIVGDKFIRRVCAGKLSQSGGVDVTARRIEIVVHADGLDTHILPVERSRHRDRDIDGLCSCARALDARKNSSKILGSSSSGIPMPSSLMLTVMKSLCSTVSTFICPPAEVYFIEFNTKFVIISSTDNFTRF